MVGDHDDGGAQAPERRRLDEFTLADLEAVRLVLRGDSVIDWHRLNLKDRPRCAILLAQEFHPTSHRTARAWSGSGRAISYPAGTSSTPSLPIERASVRSSAWSPGAWAPADACTIPGRMHIIHHIEGASCSSSSALRPGGVPRGRGEGVPVIGSMLAGGFHHRVRRRAQNKDSLYTKLLSKTERAPQIYDGCGSAS